MTPLGGFLVLMIFIAIFGGLGWLIWRQHKIGRCRGAKLAARIDEKGWRLEHGREGRSKVTSLAASDGSWILSRISTP